MKPVVLTTILIGLLWQTAVSQSVEAVAERGISLMEQGKLPEAEAEFARALKLSPLSFELHNLLGVVLDQQGKHDQARSEFVKSIALSKNYPPAHRNLGLNAAQRKDYRTSVAEFEKALSLTEDAETADALRFDLALALYRNGEYERSLSVLGQIRNRNAKDAGYYALAGSNYRELGDLGSAVRDLTRAADLEAGNTDYLYDLAIALIRNGSHEAAIERLTAGIQSCPRCANLYAAKGVALYATGNNEDSANNYEKAVQLDPTAADIHIALADLYAATGALAKAEPEYEIAVRLDGSSAAYRVKQARNWLALDKTTEAENGFRKALSMDPANTDAYLNLGKIAAARGDAQSAVRNLEKAAQLQPGNSAALYQLAMAYRKVGQTGKADATLARFRKIKDLEKDRNEP